MRKLRKRFGREPSGNDVEWTILNDDILNHAKEANWGLYRNARFSMAEILANEGRHKQSLQFLVEVCYLDLNGPNNCGGVQDDPQLRREFPPFDPKAGDLAPGIIGRVLEKMEQTETSLSGLESEFMDVANRVQATIKPPLPPAKAWKKVKRELNA